MFSAPPSNTSCVYARGFVRVLSKWARHRLRDRTWTAGATRARRRGQRLGRAARRGAGEDEPNRKPRRRGPLHLTPALRSVPHGLRFSGGSVGSRAPRACSGGGDAPLTLVWGGARAAGPAEAGTPPPGEPSVRHGRASVLPAFARALGFWFSKGLTTRVRTHTRVHTRAQPCTRTDLREQLPVSVTASPEHETSAQRTRAFGQRLSRDWKPFPRTACVRAPGTRPRRPSTLHAVKAPAWPRQDTHRRNDAGRLGEEEERRHVGSESSSCLKCDHYRFCAKAVCSVLLQIWANSYNKEGTAPDASIDPRLAIIIAAS